ncbi:ubiquitin-like domain-containing CTD phosphatase 1 [Oppia nitens]|uniref:ubiquitin-like domain-containing CTD phosphatase 1 n=1 Tax=Oppia nitens TaxID=1686743 RepID=UPI0023DBB8D6|nr:ubiquitin-like domain-containing CTD phosphatase 1 [Oppia nitens]
MSEELATNGLTLVVKWSSHEYTIDSVTIEDTVLDLKKAIFKNTGVKPERQKLMGLKSNGKPATDEMLLSKVDIRPNMKIMMMGSKETDIASVDLSPQDIPNVINDFDIGDDIELGNIPIQNREEFLAKVDKRVKDYKIKMLSEPRNGKKLLVLDIDYTLFDHRSTAECAAQLMRPYLHEFLTIAYEDYDIVIWSATGMKWIEVKMRELGVEKNTNYKIVFYLDSSAMISVHTTKYGLVDVKPLGVIWGKFKEYSPKNTIMFDDIRKNFLMNPQNGLRIRAFREANKNRDTDNELYYLSKYLKKIAKLDDFGSLNHRHWQRYLNQE